MVDCINISGDIIKQKKLVMKSFLRILASFIIMSSIYGCSNKESEMMILTQTLVKFNEVLINPEHKQLADLVSDSLSYGHSSGAVENKSQFIETLVQGNSNFLSIDISDQHITILKNMAVVRHNLSAIVHDKNKPQASINLHILMVWERTDANWILVARQAVRI